MQEALQALLDCLHEAERRAEDEETQPVLLLLLDLLLQAPLTTPLTPRGPPNPNPDLNLLTLAVAS